MTTQELALCAIEYELPIKVLIINNHFLGMVRQWQEVFYDERYSCRAADVHPDFVKIAEAYGASPASAATRATTSTRIEKALRHAGGGLLDFHVANVENCYPMMPPGR